NAISATSQQGAGSIRVKCVSGQTYAITLDGGLYGSVATRRMANIANTALTLTYNLYSDRPGGIVWDNTTGVAATGNGNDQWYPIYGLVPAQTTPVAGTYRDTVNVTISW
ncbi:spore coat U domain-containing protein, partial [Pseudomonas aeruginosa]|nr:spore coat U domain-containing protein [Pseudomonas aeruginosa]